jgi:HK97 family phage prohead protease
MRFKNYKNEIVDVADKGIVTIAISRFDNEDAGEDIVRKGAFERTFREGKDRIKHYIDHVMKQEKNVGLPIKMYETSTHAVVESALNLEKEISRDLFADYKFYKEHGKSLEHSFGYETIKGKARSKRGEEIFELKMYEYSTVGYAMNPETPLLDLKSFDNLAEQIDNLEQYLRKYDVSKTKGEQIEQIIKLIKGLTHDAPESVTHNPINELNKLLNTKNIFKNG